MIKREVVKELVLALLYLTSWEEKEYGNKYNRSWKGYPFDLMDELIDESLISGGNRAKSIYLSDDGVKKALEIIEKYNFEKEDIIPKKKKTKKKESKEYGEKEIRTEEEYDEYMAGLYGLDSIAGYTDGGFPFGVSNDEIEDGQDEDNIFIDSDDEIPF